MFKITGSRLLSFAALFAAACALIPAFAAEKELPALTEIQVKSTADGSQQPSLVWAPETAKTTATPLLVLLHSWSGDYTQANTDWQQEAVNRGWIYIQPNFRGINQQPTACGSSLARQDVLDAIDFVSAKYKVDSSRIYVAGTSGGGHMAMLLAGYYPKRFSGVSAWVGISDLAEWYRFHTRGEPTNYAKMILACCKAAPGTSAEVDADYRSRSPLSQLQNVGDLPLDLNAGVTDGHSGSVPIHHSLWAYNAIAKAGKHPEVSQAEIDELWNNGKLSQPKASDVVKDATYERELLLRRQAGATRITIFEGGHEGLAHAASEWLSKQKRETKQK